jgi:hypothetical protein
MPRWAKEMVENKYGSRAAALIKEFPLWWTPRWSTIDPQEFMDLVDAIALEIRLKGG